jgi:hypothetical protein
MEWPLIVVLVTSLLGFVIVGLSNVVYYGIGREVNGASPEDQRVTFWKIGLKSRSFLKRHRELFPSSKKRLRMGWLSTIGLLLFFGAIIFGILATHAGLIRN